jgi:hypothetical protein
MATAPSLFGATPESIQQARDAALNQEANAYAQLDPFQRASAGLYRGGNQLGGAIGRMLGGQDPEMQRASLLRQLGSQADSSTPEGMAAYAQALRGAGLQQEAFAASQQAQAMQLKGAELDKTRAETLKAGREKAGADPIQQLLRTGKFTTESVAAYEQTGRIDSLVSVDPKLQTQVVETRDGQILINKETGQPIANIGQSPVRGTTITNDLKQTPNIIGAVKDFEDSVKPYRETLDSATRGKSFLNETLKGNSAAFEQSRTTLAKAVGEGKLSNEDIKRAGIDPRIVAGALDWINKKIVGVPNEDIIKQMYTLFNIMERDATKNIDSRAGRMQGIARASNFGGDLQTFFPTSTGSQGGSEEEAYQAFKRKKQGGQ